MGILLFTKDRKATSRLNYIKQGFLIRIIIAFNVKKPILMKTTNITRATKLNVVPVFNPAVPIMNYPSKATNPIYRARIVDATSTESHAS